jgi:RND superfamily putative drug exporter
VAVIERLAGWATRHRWWTVLIWVLFVGALVAGSQALGSRYHNDFSLPGTQSQEALDLLRTHSPGQAGDTVQVVVASPSGVTASSVADVTSALVGLPHVASVGTPVVSSHGTVGYAVVTLDAVAQDIPAADIQRIITTAQGASSLEVQLGGDAIRGAEEGGGGPAEGVGILAALIILVLLFGSLLAASLPVLIAIFAVAGAIGLTAMASHVADVADFTVPLMILVGLGVGIDYALLVFSRYRGELLAGFDRDVAVGRALATAGRTIFFAAATVMIALLGLVVLGLGSLQGVAVAVALTGGVTMLAALTLLPALLAIMGKRLSRGILKRARPSLRRGARPNLHSGDGEGFRSGEGDRWRRWTDGVHKRPWLAATAGVLVLLALAAPAIGLRLGFADAGNHPAGSTSRAAYDLLAEGFGPGFNAPIPVVAPAASATAVHSAIEGLDGAASVTQPFPSADGQIALMLVYSRYAPQDVRTDDLVAALRKAAPDAAVAAVSVDFAAAVADRLPLFVAVVVGLSAILLMLVFRSLLIPIKAAILNLLSVGAALGIISLVFQRGWFGVPVGPIEAYVPVMIFAIAFGLSMDYEVFLVSRMREEWLIGRDADGAVREGLATTGRVVTAAAAIMVVVFGGFLLDPSRMLQQFGLGLAAAVLLDALVIRCLILPAVMRLLGARAWWFPFRRSGSGPRPGSPAPPSPDSRRTSRTVRT